MVRLAKAQMKVISTNRGRKYAMRPIANSSTGLAVSFPGNPYLFKTRMIITEAAIVIMANRILMIRKALVCRSSLKSL